MAETEGGGYEMVQIIDELEHVGATTTAQDLLTTPDSGPHGFKLRRYVYIVFYFCLIYYYINILYYYINIYSIREFIMYCAFIVVIKRKFTFRAKKFFI